LKLEPYPDINKGCKGYISLKASPMTEHFGKRLRRLRGERSQREVASDLGIPTTTLSSLEQQETVPRGPMLRRLIEHFGVSLDYFFPTESKASRPAREMLRELRGRNFNVAPTIATHSSMDFEEKDKEQFANLLKAKIAQTEN
jgi:putative transcriptional regulator